MSELLFGVGAVVAAVFIVILLTALPLYIAVHLLGGRASIWTVLKANIFVGLLGVGLQMMGIPGFLAFIAGLFIYRSMFDMGFFRTLIAVLLQGVVAVALVLVAMMLFGLSLGSFLAFAV